VRRTDRGSAALPAFLERFEVDTVLDVGANVGQYGSALRAAGYSGRIVSFEPNPEAYRHLAERAARDRSWDAVGVGLGAEDGFAELNVSGFSVFSSMLKTTEFVESVDGRSRAEQTVRVPVTTVDAAWAERVRPGARVLLKVDTQGQKILLTEPPMNPLKNREQMCEVMFDRYGFGGVYVAIQAVLALYAQGTFPPPFYLMPSRRVFIGSRIVTSRQAPSDTRSLQASARASSSTRATV